MALDAAVDFLNIEVMIARNPSRFGYHHGPIPRGENFVISSINTRVCDVVVAAHGTMCGKTFRDNGSLYRHIRKQHPDFRVTTPSRANVRMDEEMAGKNVIRRWVLEGGWRRARYVYEPRQLHANSLIMQYADDFELLAERCAEFRDSFGSRFHRPSMVRSRAPQPLSFTSSDARTNATEQHSSSDSQV